jgi:hypothetical protein
MYGDLSQQFDAKPVLSDFRRAADNSYWLINRSYAENHPPLQSGSSLKQPTGLFLNAWPFAAASRRLNLVEGIWDAICFTYDIRSFI